MFTFLIICTLAGGGFYFWHVHTKQEEQRAADEAKAKADAQADAAQKLINEQEQRKLAEDERKRLADEAGKLRWELVPFKDVRQAHHWIIGRSGHGKTQAIQHFISLDIPKVLMGEMSVIVIDSQSQMIPLLSSLDVWKGNDKLLYIDPARDSPALNLFDVKPGQNINTVMESFRFIINSILASSEFTGKQGLLFDMLMQLMLRIEGANIHTLIDLLSDTGIERYRTEIASLPPSPRKFFETEYTKRGKTDQYKATRDEVSRRLWQILANPTFDAMFSSRHMSVDFVREMQAGKLILIDTNKAFFAETNSAIMGSLFFGLIYQAILSRGENAKPCVVYIDEVQEYFQYNGSVLAGILAQARKYNVGIVMAHHFLEQLSKAPGLLGALSTSTAIKMAGGTSSSDAKSLGSMFRVPAFTDLTVGTGRSTQVVSIQAPDADQIIFNTKQFEFLTYIPQMWHYAQVLTIEPGRIERMQRSSYRHATAHYEQSEPMTPGQQERARRRAQSSGLRLIEDKRDNTKAGDW